MAEEIIYEPTKVESGEIKAIAKDAVHRICAGQVVLTLAVAVKELVENSIDAGASLVEIKLREHGLESLEVSDNGTGVREKDLEAMTAKYHTSKIKDFVDLQNVETFGFRGEALSSLCALSDLLVLTRHASQEVGVRMELDHQGKIKKRTLCARGVGTTVTLTNLFATLPVRRRDFTRNVRKEFTKMCQILQAYCLVARGVRIICTNQNAKGTKMVVMQTHGSRDVLANVGAVFGNRQASELLPLKSIFGGDQALTEDGLRAELQSELGTDDSMQITAEDVAQLNANNFKLEGYVSSCNHGAGRSSKDRQYFYINSRPCDPKSISKIVNETYHRYNSHQYPFIFLNIVISRSDVDVNLTPDKRQLLIHNEKILLIAIKKAMLSTYGNLPSTYKLQNSTIVSMCGNNKDNGQNEDVKEKEASEDTTENTPISSSQRFMDVLSQWKKTGDTVGIAPQVSQKRKYPDEVEVRTLKLKKIHEYLNRENTKDCDMPKEFKVQSESDDDEANQTAKPNIPNVVMKEKSALDNSVLDLQGLSKESMEFDSLTEKTLERPDREVLSVKPESISHLVENGWSKVDNVVNSENENSEGECEDDSEKCSQIPAPAAVILDDSQIDAEFTSKFYSTGIMRITLSEIERNIKAEEKLKTEIKQSNRVKLERLRFKSEINPSQNLKAEEELEREISKDTFAKMEILGQFNLGFIIVKLDTDLFIIDQHATDEKYNFEMLQRTTVMQSQPLAVPQPLELTAANEMLLLDHLSVFEKNGFKFEINENATPTKRVKLLCKPSSQRWEFGKEDIDELLFMLQDAPAGSVCRPSRIRDMFASRACRKSVMIGTALKHATMKKLVTHMGEIEQPWDLNKLELKLFALVYIRFKTISHQLYNFRGVSSFRFW
ncbi:mismatch repair endonuclease PMS2 isoform X1 [Zeugodacus cucurbitae]|uniref:mismatch repair endonuclease PMS2 isoform X1 n=1 Tax=Zeugodacus cucurbitae TaxID=28588 RepID=UPI0023D900E9|nr:mismatch repair endonuclease PMS2 isoform X1 [Zeugodacus cucurbitae]